VKLNLAPLAAAATGVQVGAAIVASRFVVADVPPLTLALALLRYAIGFACLLPFLLRSFMAPALYPWSAAAIFLIASGLWLAPRSAAPARR